MDKDLKQVIVQMLTIIGYTDDKDAFATEFLGLIQQKAMVTFLQSLPKDKQEEYNKVAGDTLKDAFAGYTKAIQPTLSEDQKQKLQQYLSSLTATS